MVSIEVAARVVALERERTLAESRATASRSTRALTASGGGGGGDDAAQTDAHGGHPPSPLLGPRPPAAKGRPSATVIALQVMTAARRPQRASKAALSPTLTGIRTHEAFLAQAAGDVVDPPCTCCADGDGHWLGCVVVSGRLRGCCANCHYATGGSDCSFQRQVPTARPAAPTSPAAPTPPVAPTPPAVPTPLAGSHSSGDTAPRPTSRGQTFVSLYEAARGLTRWERDERMIELELEIVAIRAANRDSGEAGGGD